jgi:uracil-DNA glycosylase
VTSGPWGDGRGSPWEYDAGPPRNRRLGRLFAETPNYRGLGRAITGREAFRWHFGPMFYRGRLVDGHVKVLVIGQEGAQDESLAARAFVGGTGARMQHLLGHLGITRSYLFLNTFVYPIFGQYTGQLRWLAQHPDSPIVQHRHRVLDEVSARNDLRLVIAVGTAAKESVVTWVAAHGGSTGGPSDVERCDASVLGRHLKLIGVVHPGAAAAGGAGAVVADFRRAIAQVEAWAAADPGWLPPDPDGERGAAGSFVYRSAPIPFRDLPYGTSWRLGRGATSSNRADAQRSIQLFGAGGSYNARGDRPRYPSTALGTDEGYEADAGELAYEPPRRPWGGFDRGPTPAYARLLQGGVASLPWPDAAELGLPGDGSFGLGGGYRGRFDDVSALVWADQESHDDLFCGRAMCGDGGQHLQGLLQAMGVSLRYLILRVLPFDTLGVHWATVRRAVEHPKTVALHTELFTRIREANPQLGVVLTVGTHARALVEQLPIGPLPVVDLAAWHASGARADWRRALERLRDVAPPTDTTPTWDWDGRRRQIPREDLPYGALRWRGTSGDRAVRAEEDGRPSTNYLKLFAPAWAANLPPDPLSPDEQAAVDLAP